MAPVRFVLELHLRTQEPVIRLLQQIVGRLPVAGDARQVGPERACGAVVEGAECVLIHLERHVERGGGSIEALHVREGERRHRYEICSGRGPAGIPSSPDDRSWSANR